MDTYVRSMSWPGWKRSCGEQDDDDDGGGWWMCRYEESVLKIRVKDKKIYYLLLHTMSSICSLF